MNDSVVSQVMRFLCLSFFPGVTVLAISTGLFLGDFLSVEVDRASYVDQLNSVVTGVNKLTGIDFFSLSAYWAGSILVLSVVKLMLNPARYFTKQPSIFYGGTPLDKKQWKYHSLVTTGEFAGCFVPTQLVATASVLSLFGSNSMAADLTEAEALRRMFEEADEIKRLGGSIVYHDPKDDKKHF